MSYIGNSCRNPGSTIYQGANETKNLELLLSEKSKMSRDRESLEFMIGNVFDHFFRRKCRYKFETMDFVNKIDVPY